MVGLQYVPAEFLEEAAAYADFFAGRTDVYPTLYEDRLRSYGFDLDEEEDTGSVLLKTKWINEGYCIEEMLNFENTEDEVIHPFIYDTTTSDMISTSSLSDCEIPTGISSYFEDMMLGTKSTLCSGKYMPKKAKSKRMKVPRTKNTIKKTRKRSRRCIV